MNNREKILIKSLSTPRRKLSSDFTARVVAEIKSGNHNQQKGRFFMKYRFAPAIIGIIASFIILTGGAVTYAATEGFTKPFNFNNIFGYQEKVEADGKKIVAIQTSSCSPVDSSINPTDRMLWFRLKEDSSLNSEQLLSYAQGFCDNNNQLDFYKTIREYTDVDEFSWINVGEIAKINKSELQIKSDSTLGYTQNDLSDFLIQDNALIFDGNNRIKNTELKAGDTIYYAVENELNNEGAYQSNSNVIFISKMTKNEAFYLDKWTADGPKQAERVQPCRSDPTGYCAYGFGEDDKDPAVTTAKDLIKQAYTDYAIFISEPDDITVQDSMERHQKKVKEFERYTTKELADYLSRSSGADPISCIQQHVSGETISYGSSIKNESLVTVPVIRTYPSYSGEGITTEVFADAVYDIKTKKISSWTCLNRLSL